MNEKAKPLCCVPKCSRVSISRGMCQSCYVQARRSIKIGMTTWAALEAEGLAIKPFKGRNGPLSNAIAKIKKKGGK
jgi:hypothetical protein